MLTSENGIRESHSGQKYGRVDIPNRKLTKVCLTAPMASHWRKNHRVRITLPPSLMALSDFIAGGISGLRKSVCASRRRRERLPCGRSFGLPEPDSPLPDPLNQSDPTSPHGPNCPSCDQ